MKEKEKKLFLELCAFLSPNKEKINKLIEKGGATPELLGHLFANRMAGVAYRVLENTELLSCVDREFRNSLKAACNFNEKLNEDFFGCLNYVSTQLDACGVPYALLKGAYLCGKYPIGYRTSNDIDVLINPEDIGKVSTKLKLAGFRQGHLKNGKFVEATRQEIIESKMTRGETVPFIKEIKLPYIKYLEVDINFSLDYKNSDDNSVKKMLERTQIVSTKNVRVRTLCLEDFFLHLCSHLYKEATTIPWIKMKRDMTFYKYLDIYMLINEMDEEIQANVIAMADKYGLKTELLYCLNSVNEFFSVPKCRFIKYVMECRKEDLNTVIAPSEKKIYEYTEKDVVKRFFNSNRIKLLREVTK